MAGSRVVHWNGRDVPDELRELPAGNYVLEPIEAAHDLTAEEDEGLRTAMASMRAGRGQSLDQVEHRLDAILRR